MKKIKGLTLVEMMLALSLSVMLSSYFYQIYLFIDKEYQFIQASVELQQTLRTVSMIIIHAVHEEGMPAVKKFFIQSTEHHNQDGTLIMALFYKNNNAKPIEIAENIDQLSSVNDVDYQNNIIGVMIQFHVREYIRSSLLNQKGYVYVALPHSMSTRPSVTHGVGINANHVDRQRMPLEDEHDGNIRK